MKKKILAVAAAAAMITCSAGNAIPAITPMFSTLTASAAGETQLNPAELADGKYSLAINMVKVDTESESMSSAAVNPDVTLSVENGAYYIIVEFQGITILDTLGYLKTLSYYNDGYTYDRFGNPKGTYTTAEVLSVYDGYVDMYNDADTPYPHMLKFPLVDKYMTDEEYNAGKNIQFVPLHVYVPAMAGFEDQDVLMKLNWDTLEKKQSYLTGSQLSVSGDITMSNYIELSDDILSDSGAKVVTEVNGLTKETALSSLNSTENGYAVPVNVPAKDMTSDVTISVQNGTGEVVDTYTVSVEEYALKIVYGDYTDKQKKMAKALLNYGAYAQAYFGTNTDKPANANLETADQWTADSLNTVSFDTYGYTKPTNDTSEVKVRYMGSCLSLVSKTAIKHYFKITDLDGVTITVNGKVATPVAVTDDSTKKNWYWVAVTGISAANLAQKYDVVVTRGTASYTLSYSAMDYCKVAQDDTDENLTNLTKALYLFYDSAK